MGKSTLFNRITGSRRAIVAPVAGTTRDTKSQPAEWLGTPFTLVDTGGLFGASEDPLHASSSMQGRKALESADVIVFVVDGREGLVSADEEIARHAARVERAGDRRREQDRRRRARGRAVEFYRLGFEP